MFGCKNPSNGISNNSNQMLKTPLTIEVINPGTITLSRPDLFTNLRYKINDGEFINAITQSSILVNTNDKITFFADGSNNESLEHLNINCSSDCYVYGNIMSLLTQDFKNAKEITSSYAFLYLFADNTHIKSLPQKNLLLPATTLKRYCYSGMFQHCSSLTTAPDLPAIKLKDYCYKNMFASCTKLEKAPALPATTLGQECYSEMFAACSSLTATPKLLALNLKKGCYHKMFAGCTSLTQVTELPSTSLADECYAHMFRDCTLLTNAPKLPAENLVSYCYYQMFCGCSSLKNITCLAKNIYYTDRTYFWLSEVSSTGTFIKNKDMNEWSRDEHGIPSGWTVVDAD